MELQTIDLLVPLAQLIRLHFASGGPEPWFVIVPLAQMIM